MTDFLGIDTFFQQTDTIDFSITLSGMKKIIIKNQFFSNHQDGLEYISSSSLPHSIDYWTEKSLAIDNLPVLYGQPRIDESTNEYILHADIIASAYFMLSRWEEIVDTQTDKHKRVQGHHSISHKYNFLHRPIVNEYADLLWNILLKAGYKGERKKFDYKNVVTHDVDQQYKWPDWYTGIKHIGGDLIKRKDPVLATKNLGSFLATKLLDKQDPFDHHESLLQKAAKYPVSVYFNFMVSRESKEDVALKINDPRLISLIKKIESAGHTIGFHPGYNTYLNQEKFNQEFSTLQRLTSQKIVSGRQHFLRFRVPDTWRLWNNAGMEWESSMSYSDTPGFRCGTCYTYTVFDCIERKKLRVKEKPLIVMDATLIYYQPSIDYNKLYELKNQCKKHNGEFVTIWHNDLVEHPDLKNFELLIYS